MSPKKVRSTKKVKTKKRKLVRRRKAIGVLNSPTRTHTAEMYCTDENVQEQDFVYMFDKENRKIIGRVTDLQSQWSKKEDAVETYADLEVYGILNERGKITLKRKPLPPDTKVYKMTSKQVAKLLNLMTGLYIGKMALTDTQVRIDPDKFLRGHTMVVGKTGAGKSWGIGCLLEEVSKLDLPAIVIDPHGEYLTLASAYDEKEAVKILEEKWDLEPTGFKLKIITANPESKQLGQEYIRVHWPEQSRERQDPEVYYRRFGIISAREWSRESEEETVEEDDLDKFVEMYRTLHKKEPSIAESGDIKRTERPVELTEPNLMEPNAVVPKPVITYTIRKGDVDMELSQIMEPGYITVIDLHNLDPDESRAAVDWIAFRLFLLRKQRKISPFVLVIEEAHIFCPSEGKVWSSDTIMMLAKEARKFGMPTTFATQRPVLLKTTVRANCENWIVLKITHPSDKSSIIDACEGLDSKSAETIKNLPVGFAFLTGTIVEFPLVVEIRHRQSQHFYESGFREQLQEYDAIVDEPENDQVLEENK